MTGPKEDQISALIAKKTEIEKQIQTILKTSKFRCRCCGLILDYGTHCPTYKQQEATNKGDHIDFASRNGRLYEFYEEEVNPDVPTEEP